eukprot:scaffold129010_cov69-Phaeocystis_antarctica.AAC.1
MGGGQRGERRGSLDEELAILDHPDGELLLVGDDAALLLRRMHMHMHIAGPGLVWSVDLVLTSCERSLGPAQDRTSLAGD